MDLNELKSDLQGLKHHLAQAGEKLADTAATDIKAEVDKLHDLLEGKLQELDGSDVTPVNQA